jgi:hypothetical protein
MNTPLLAFLRRSVTSVRLFCALMALLVLAISPAPRAEYLIYLKGGHYIVSDNCTFSTKYDIGEDTGKDDRAEREESAPYQDCTQGEPEGRIFWSTIDGKFGEVNADDVYAILGARTLTLKKPPPAKGPLEDYLITNRGESFVNAKIYQERDATVYGVKRDELAKIDRKAVTDIVREGEAKSRSGEGLCPGEPAEFSVTETELVGSNLVGVVTNLSKAPWKPRIDVEVQVKGRRFGKFEVEDSSILPPDDSILIDFPVPARFVKHVERLADPHASVRICYRKVKTGVRQPVAGQPPAAQSPR